MLSEIVDNINSKISNAGAQLNEAEVGSSSVTVNAEAIEKVCHYLKDSEYEFNALEVITGCDYEDRIEVTYAITSYTKNHDVLLKVKLPKPAANETVDMPSVCSVWASANFQERECFDMVGVSFSNHPDMRRILCPEDWEGFPLRKDYKVQEKYHDMDVNPEHKINNPDHFYFQELQKHISDPKKSNLQLERVK
jgi:NADH-quinone oxidoreductase subunit C